MDEAPDSLIADDFNWFYISFSSNSPGISRCFEGILTVLGENHGEEKNAKKIGGNAKSLDIQVLQTIEWPFWNIIQNFHQFPL